MVEGRLVCPAGFAGAALVFATPDVRIHRAAHDRARTHDRDLDRQVLEIPGSGAPQHLDLRPALDLEQPHGVPPADAIVDRGVGEVDARGIGWRALLRDRKSTRLNSSHDQISYAVFCLKKKNT